MPSSAIIRLPKKRASDLEATDAPVVVPVEPVDQIDVRELARKLWRRKWPMLGTAATVMVLAVLILFQLTPIYRATALVMVDAREAEIVNIKQVLAGLSPGEETIQSEVQVLGSRDLAKQTIAKLGLNQNPEFNGELRPHLWLNLVRDYLPEEWAAMLFEAPAQGKGAGDVQESQFVDAFEARLGVAPVPLSRVISVSFDSKDPRLAARIVNTLVDFYFLSQLDAKFEATKRANSWLSDHLKSLREQTLASEAAVEAYRKQAGLLRTKSEWGKDTTIATEELSGIDVELLKARADRAASEAKLHQVQGALSSSAGVGSVSAVLQSPLIQSLVEQQAQVERRAAELATHYGESYPAMINVRAEARDLQQKIEAEIRKIVASLQNDVVVARAREASLAETLDQAKARVALQDEADVHLRALEGEAQANRALYNNFLERFKETSNQSGELEQPDARVVSSADVPDAPTFPRKKIILGVAFVFASIAGVAVAFLLERLDQGFRSMDQIEAVTGFRSLGLIPTLKGFARRKGKVLARLADHPATPFAESLRSLATKLLLVDAKEAPKTILFASSLPREGKTMVAVSLAYLQASVGRRVAFVDCDLRKPAAHVELNVPLKAGLVEYLAGAAAMDQVMYKDSRSGITVIPAGGMTRDPAGLLASNSMKALLEALAQSHDLVILDSAPILAVSDALALCGLVDKTVLLIRWAESRQEVALRGLQALVDAGADLAGVLLSRVDARKHARYGYADSGLYYGRVREYYGHRS
jgi:polysaccharide biosynthesis transport protein